MILRRLRTAAAVASFAFGLLVAGMAWHGRETVDRWHIRTPSYWSFVMISPRLFDVGAWKSTEFDPRGSDTVWQSGQYHIEYRGLSTQSQWVLCRWNLSSGLSSWSWRDIGWVRGQRGDAPILSFRQFWLPTWLVVVPTMLPLCLGVGIRLCRRRRGRPGHCRKCGYDLRGTPGRCPECGTVPPVAGRAG